MGYVKGMARGLMLFLLTILLLVTGVTAAGLPPEHARAVEIEVVAGQTVVWVVDHADHTRVQVAQERFAVMPAPMFEKFVALSPDGQQVAYVTADDLMMSNARLWVVDVESTQRRLLAVFRHDFWVAPLVWDPDGRYLAFIRVGRGDTLELWTLDAHTGGQRLVSSVVLLRPERFYGFAPNLVRWSAEGPYLAQADFGVASPQAELPCSVPLFAQNDPRWRDNVMQTCDMTIGQAGCALTSSAMAFNYYGATTDPPALNTCLGDYACPLYWSIAAGTCSQGRATWLGRYDFNWNRLEQELAAGRPPLLGMEKDYSHYVLVVAGSGSDPAGYTVHDPWDARVRNLADFSAWSFEWLVIYGGEPWCGWPPDAPALLEPAADAALDQHTVAFRWQPSGTPGVDGYTFRINHSADPEASPLIEDTDLVSATVAYTHTLDSDGSYYWHVRAWEEDRPSSWASRFFLVDTTPPTSSVAPLSSTMASNYFVVHWSGSDTLSGLVDYDVQVREGTTVTWTDWLTGVTAGEAWFLGEMERTYYFQSRARDRAGNQEAYPGGDGDTHTAVTLCVPDGYEEDDGPASADLLAVGEVATQHNVCGTGDEDWFAFDAERGKVYLLRALNLGPYADVVLTLYGTDGQRVLGERGGAGVGIGHWLAWRAPADGRYYGRARHAVGEAAGSGLTYDVVVMLGGLVFLPLAFR